MNAQDTTRAAEVFDGPVYTYPLRRCFRRRLSRGRDRSRSRGRRVGCVILTAILGKIAPVIGHPIHGVSLNPGARTWCARTFG